MVWENWVPDYDFHTLSPMDFELMVRDLLQVKLGLELKAFAHGPDGGVDLRGQRDGRLVVVQCKHYRGSTFHDLKKSAKHEKLKMDRVGPAEYYFVTSQNLVPQQVDQIVDELAPHLESAQNIYTGLDLNNLLALNPAIERNNFKLWMASANVIREIVLSGIWHRNEALMEEIQDRVRLYVYTPSFAQAREVLNEKKVCVITGAPGVGKSMLADMLALSYWRDGWKVIDLPSHQINKAWDVLNKDEKQMLYFDDVFGQTDVQERLSHDGGKTVAQLINYVGKSSTKRLVITTRTHILQEAESRDEPLSRADLHARECIVQVSEYSSVRRARVLYNHLYFSNLPREVVREFVNQKWHLRVIKHANFTPRLIEITIGQHNDGDSAKALFDRMIHSLDHPVELWGPSFREALSETARTILLQLVTFPTYGAERQLLRSAAGRDASPIEYERALRQLEGSWIAIGAKTPGGEVLASFQDPSCRDFVLSFIDSHPEYVEQICRDASHSLQIALLLRYGQSVVDSSRKPKYPALKEKLERNPEELSLRIRSLWELDPPLARRFADTALSIFLEVSEEIGFDLREWVIDQALRFSEWFESSDELDGSDARDLATAIMDSGRTATSQEELLSCKFLYMAWADAIGGGEADEWKTVFEFGSMIENHPLADWSSNDSVAIQNSFERWLDAELEASVDNADSGEDAIEWISDAKEIAETYFGGHEFYYKFMHFEDSIQEKWGRAYDPGWEDRNYVRSGEEIESTSIKSASLFEELNSTTDAPQNSFRGNPFLKGAGREEAEISALFDQLS